MWVQEEDYRGIWERWEPAHLGDWPSGDGVPEMCCEAILTRRKVSVEDPPENLSPGVRAWVDKIPRDKEGHMWRYEPFHDTHCLAKRVVPETGTDVLKMGTMGDAYEPVDHKRRASGE